MHRFVFLLVLISALLGLIEHTQGQSRHDVIAPAVQAQPDLGFIESIENDDQGVSLELDEPVDEDGVKRNEMPEQDDLDDAVTAELDQTSLRRLTDDQIRNNWPKHSIKEIGLSLDEVGRVPEDRSGLLEEYGRFGPVSESVKVFAWEAPDIRYQPLFFEDVVLERYGQTLPDYRQSIRSAIHFGTAFTGLSLQLTETPSRSCDYSLGYCRPGTCVPQTTQRHFFGPLSLR